MDINSVLPICGDSAERYHKELMDAINQREQMFQSHAQCVFDAVMAYSSESELILSGVDPVTKKIKLTKPGADELNAAIANGLNNRSIGYFIELISKHRGSANQAANAMKRHAENHAMKADVFTWLNTNMANFKSMDAAAEGIAGKVAPIAFRTARDWVGEWKKLRSASTP